MLAEPEVVARTKMPISNLTLVLAPTLSISLPVLQVLGRHREVVFAGPAPSEDPTAGAGALLQLLQLRWQACKQRGESEAGEARQTGQVELAWE